MRGMLAAAILMSALSALSARADAAVLTDHRALYKMSLARTTPASLIQGLAGEMVLEVKSTCDGSTVTQTLVTDFWNEDGAIQRGELTASSFESVDGLRFRFAFHNEIEGNIIEAFKGLAERAATDVEGAITYEEERFAPAVLPAGAVFPTQYMLQLLAAAEEGERAINVVVFDGAEDAKIFKSTAIIGRPAPVDPRLDPKLKAGDVYWPVVLSYFPAGSDDPYPEYESSFHVYANGVSDRLIMDYGDFAMRGELTALQLFDPPDCAGD